ncbi:Nose resistant to fluoxetine protein 6-like Protein [Gryllus bimaculatus]|nr:Nose resistant to fluoxetine protein 6-like Protein [Gryllus bimaculatus]
MFARHTGYGGLLNRFLNCYAFRVLSRISYSTNMAHFILLLHNSGRRRVPVWFDIFAWVFRRRRCLLQCILSIKARLLNRFLNCYAFRVLSRISYSTNMAHFILLLHNSGRRRVPVWFDIFEWVFRRRPCLLLCILSIKASEID